MKKRYRLETIRNETISHVGKNENYIDINRVPHNEFATLVFVLGRAGDILHRCVSQTLENARLVVFYLTSCRVVLKVENLFAAS